VAPRQLLADAVRDEAALLLGEIVLGHGTPFPSRSVQLRTNPHNCDSPLRNKTGKDARSAHAPGAQKEANGFLASPSSAPPDGACEESGDGPCPTPPPSSPVAVVTKSFATAAIFVCGQPVGLAD
jgi:hypothetical protein